MFRKEMKKWRNVLWVVLASLMLGGLSSFLVWRKYSPTDIHVAVVNGRPIYLKQFQQEIGKVQSYIENLRQYARAQSIPIELFLSLSGMQDPQKTALNSLIREKSIEHLQEQFGIILDTEHRNEALLKSIPAFLLNPNGTINESAYRSYVARRRMTIAEFEDNREEEIKRELIENVIRQASYTPNYIVPGLRDKIDTVKSFAIAKVPLSLFLSQAKKTKASEDDLLSFYQTNKGSYRVPEKRKIRYWMVNSEVYLKKTEVDQSIIERFYERTKSSLFRIPPKVKVRRLVLKKGSGEKERNDSLLKIQGLRAQIVATPENFAMIARKHSQDSQTASRGGLVDFFERGTYDPVFEKAALRLQTSGELSSVITTQDGYEIVQLVERIPATTKALDEVKGEIVKSIKAKKALRTMKSAIGIALRKVRSDKKALHQFAQKNSLKEHETGWLTHKDIAGKELINKIAQKVFEAKKSVHKQGTFSHGDDYVVYELVSSRESTILPFEKVKEEVEKDLYNSKATRELKKAVKSARSNFFKNEYKLEKSLSSFSINVDTVSEKGLDEALKDKKYPNILFRRAFALNSPHQLFSFHHEDDYYLVQLVSSKEKEDAPHDGIEAEERERKRQIYLDSFIASLLRVATIEKNEQMLHQNVDSML